MSLRARTAIVLAALLLMGAPVRADGSVLHATALTYDDAGQQVGQLQMFSFADAQVGSDPLGPAASASPTTPWIDLRAAHIELWSFTQTYLRGPDGSVEQLDPRGSPEPVVSFLDDVDLRLSAQQPGFQVNLYSLGAPQPYSAATSYGSVVSKSDVQMGIGGFEQPSGERAGSKPTFGEFALVEHPGPILLHEMEGAGLSFSLLATGDLVVELYGLTLTGTAAGEDLAVSSGSWVRPVDSNLPQPTTTAASQRESRFVRLFVTGALVEVAGEGGDPRTTWAGTELQGESSGPVVLQGAVGRFGRQELRGGLHTVAADTKLALTPDAEGFAVALASKAPKTQATLVDLASPASASLVGVGAILALLAAVGVGLARRLATTPELSEVERAIEAGHYRRAAALAGRILRKAPGSEDAVLARAIALNKGGRSQLAARELSAHLGKTEASDGALHYVLGLAFLDLGRQDDGRAALREAVRRTPSLAGEVAARLGGTGPGPASGSPIPSPQLPKESNGYA